MDFLRSHLIFAHSKSSQKVRKKLARGAFVISDSEVRVKLRVGKTLEIYEAQDSEGKLTQPLFILGIGEHYLRNESRKSGTYY